MIAQQKAVRLYLPLFRFCIMNSSWIINHQKEFEKQLLLTIKVIISNNECFLRIMLWNTQQKGFRLYFVFDEILYQKRLSIFIVNKENWWLESRSGGVNVNKMLDYWGGFKLKAINHKIISCQTYIRYFSGFRPRFSILEKVFKTGISCFTFFSSCGFWEPLKWNSPCCSTASGSCLVTNRKTLVLNKI